MPNGYEGESGPRPETPQLFTLVNKSSRILNQGVLSPDAFIVSSKGLTGVLKEALRKEYPKASTAGGFTGKIDEEDHILDKTADSKSHILEPERIEAQLNLLNFTPASLEEFLRYLISIGARSARNSEGKARPYICTKVLRDYTLPISNDEKLLIDTIARDEENQIYKENLEQAKDERMMPRYLLATWNDAQNKWNIAAMTMEQMQAYTRVRPVFVGVAKNGEIAK